MTKADLIESATNKAGLPKQSVEDIINEVFNGITAALKSGEKVNISGFGTFAISQRKARTGRNPKTGESIQITASRAAKFKAGKGLKESLA